MKLVYDVGDRVPFGKNLIYAFQQLLAIMAATVLVPFLADASGVYLSQSAALLGAGVGTLLYVWLTKKKSPVFLGSSFAFIAPLAGAVTYGYCGIIMGSVFAGLVYVVIAIIVKIFGKEWLEKLMPKVIIGPTVALIGLTLSSSAISNMTTNNGEYSLITIAIGTVAFLVTVLASVKGGKNMKLIPFIIGVLAGYVLSVAVTLIGYNVYGLECCKVIDLSVFSTIGNFENWIPNITFIGAFKELTGAEGHKLLVNGTSLFTLFVAFAPVALVVFAEHYADHKNISSIIGKDLLEDPGLHRTLLGDGLGSILGAFFGGCPNTTYGESIGCVAITGNASTSTIIITALMCVLLSFFYPFIAFIKSIPNCVVGGICIALYGFIAVSGLRMFKDVDLDDNKNLFVVASILVTGIGGLALNFGSVQITNIATALIIGIITNTIIKPAKKTENK